MFAISLSVGFESISEIWPNQDFHLKLKLMSFLDLWTMGFIKASFMTSSRKLWTMGLRTSKDASKVLLLFLVGSYRVVGTTHLGGACRFTPSCSEYAVEAVHEHGFFSAIFLIFKRILKCRPGGSFGVDPVPPAQGDKYARSK